MKKFLITLSISTVIILGIWIIPEINNRSYKNIAHEQYEMMEIEQDTLSLDSAQIFYPELKEEIITYADQPFDWQAFITWIIGSLNGVFGLIIMIKKVFGKNKL